jgi:hypothetical protein
MAAEEEEMTFSTDERDFWRGYYNIKCPMEDASTRKDEGARIRAINSSTKFEPYPFIRVSKEQLYDRK